MSPLIGKENNYRAVLTEILRFSTFPDLITPTKTLLTLSPWLVYLRSLNRRTAEVYASSLTLNLSFSLSLTLFVVYSPPFFFFSCLPPKRLPARRTVSLNHFSIFNLNFVEV